MGSLDWIAADARLQGGCLSDGNWPARDVVLDVARRGATLARQLEPPKVVGLLADNSPQWVMLDVALQSAGVVVVPLPSFFSAEQTMHAIGTSGVQALLCTDRAQANRLGFVDPIHDDAWGIQCFRRAVTKPWHAESTVHETATKITFTSGTTGTPKGVCLSLEHQLKTARALAALMGEIGIRRHLSALPLAVLLENVAGVYTAMMLGASCICPPLEALGVFGASGFDAARFLQAIARYRPDSLILLPQMLQELVAHLRLGTDPDADTRSLKFVAVGGARTPPRLIEDARSLGLPVYEGYGLTECASVVCVNAPGADRIGTVGRPLPGVALRLTPDGEIEIAGRAFGGYLGGQEQHARQWLATGDLGAIDADGFVSIVGRRNDILVTSFGRNVSPEWIEALLLGSSLIVQAAVFGDACPFLVAVVVPASEHIDDAALDAHIASVNDSLPDYAKIGGWVRANAPFTARNGLATANGRIRRQAVSQYYEHRLSGLYRGGDRLFLLRERFEASARRGVAQ